jgi:uncharacterized cupin superfamily protein
MKNLKLLIAIYFAILSMQATAAPALELLALDPSELQKIELESLPSIPLGGTDVHEHAEKVLHMGDFVVAIYEAEPALFPVSSPFPYDEFIYVLEGELILTDMDGNEAVHRVGDMVNIPRGWMGTWHMTSQYRELVIVDAEAWAGTKE